MKNPFNARRIRSKESGRKEKERMIKRAYPRLMTVKRKNSDKYNVAVK